MWTCAFHSWDVRSINGRFHSWDLCSIHGMCVPFMGCVFHSWDVCSIHGMCVPFMGCVFHSQLVRLLVDCRCSRHIHGTAQPCKMRKHDLSVERGSIMNTHIDKRTALGIHRHTRRATQIELESMPHQILVAADLYLPHCQVAVWMQGLRIRVSGLSWISQGPRQGSILYPPCRLFPTRSRQIPVHDPIRETIGKSGNKHNTIQ